MKRQKRNAELDAIVQRAVEGYQINIMDLGKVQRTAEEALAGGLDVTAAVRNLLDKIAVKVGV